MVSAVAAESWVRSRVVIETAPLPLDFRSSLETDIVRAGRYVSFVPTSDERRIAGADGQRTRSKGAPWAASMNGTAVTMTYLAGFWQGGDCPRCCLRAGGCRRRTLGMEMPLRDLGIEGMRPLRHHDRCNAVAVEARFANMPPCLIGMEACVGAHKVLG